MFVALRDARRRDRVVYRGLPQRLASTRANAVGAARAIAHACYTLAALFSLDAFGGGFVVQSLVALWLYQRYGSRLRRRHACFSATGVLTAFSYLVAVRIAKRIGLVNTMVFTHLPSNLLPGR